MNLLEKITEAANKLKGVTVGQAQNVLGQIITELAEGFAVASGSVIDLSGATTAPFEIVVHTKPLAGEPQQIGIPANGVAVVIRICDQLNDTELRAAYQQIAQAKFLKKSPVASDQSNRTLGIIFGLNAALPLETIAEKIEGLNQSTPDQLWPDMFVLPSAGTINYQVQFPTIDLGGDYLPPAENSTANLRPPIYVVMTIKPSEARSLHVCMFYLMGHLRFFAPKAKHVDLRALREELPKNGIVMAGYHYDLQGVLHLVPPELRRDRMMPVLPLVIEDHAGNHLGTIRFLKWQNGGVIVYIGQLPLEGILIFLSKQDARAQIRVMRLPSAQVSHILPINENDFQDMLQQFQQRSNMRIKPDAGKFIIQKFADEGTSSPMYGRLFLGILKMQEAVFSDPKDRDQFDKLFPIIHSALLNVREAAQKIKQTWNEHNRKVASGEIIHRQPGAITVNENIDRDLQKEIESILNSAARLIKNTMQNLARELHVDIGCLFQNQNNFEAGVEKLKKTDPDLAEYLVGVRVWSEPLLRTMRNDSLEHGNWILGRVTYEFSGDNNIAKQPQVMGMPVAEYAEFILDRALCFVEDVTAYCLQKNLPSAISFGETTPSERTSENPERFRITMKVGGKPVWKILYDARRFEEK